MTAKPQSGRPSSTPPRGLDALPEALRGGVAHVWDQFREAAAEAGTRIPADPAFLSVLYRVWAASEFVAQTLVRHPELLADLLASGDLLADYAPGEFAAKARAALAPAADEAELAAALRALRRREMVRIVWRDLAGWAELGEVLRDLSLLADACIDGALQRLDGWLRREYGTPRNAAGEEQRLVVLGMGKLGAYELNVSSDIDLIFAFPEDGVTRKRGGLSNEEFFVRLGQKLIAALDQQTADGFVYRVDMRLRPFGDSGPLVMSFEALEDYYQTQGRDWERYAMIKARVVAGDRAAGAQLLEMLRPFVYRRYLDFGAFEALREMKAMIQRQVERKGMEGNVKLGPGGIREVEFIGQAFQLIRGGREPALRARGILTVLQRLTELDFLPGFVTAGLRQAYIFLRRVENRLQAHADRQTHVLPTDDTERLRLAFSMGYADWAAFHAELQAHMATVHEHFDQVFSAPQAGPAPAEVDELAALWAGGFDSAHGEAVLATAGFDDTAEALRLLERLRDGHTLRGLSARGRERVDRLLPMLLRLVNLVETVAGRTSYVALLTENPLALSQLVKLCAASPWIAQLLSHHPLLLDELLDPRSLYHPLDRAALQADLDASLAKVDGIDLEQQMEVLRHFKQSNTLRVAAADVANVMPLMVVSDHLTEIAEVVLGAVLSIATANLSVRHGRPQGAGPGGGFAVIAYGKLGGIELGYGSDLDLVFLYDNACEGLRTDGAKPMDNNVFFARLGQGVIHILNTLTPAGVLYEVDMRLRPSGGAGLLVSSLEAFAGYQRDEAWTWEHQALARARPVAGDAAVAAQFQKLRLELLGRRRDPDELRTEVRDMRERMRAELSKDSAEQFDLKQGRGGITDIEFLVQYGVLRGTAEHPDLAEFTDNIRQLEALARHRWLPQKDAEALADAYRAYRRRLHRLTLQEEPGLVPAEEFADQRRRVGELWRQCLGDGSGTGGAARLR